MKAILNPDGTFRGTVDGDVETDPTRTRTWVPVLRPDPEPGFVVEADTPSITETTVTQRWKTRPMTDAEAQKTLEQLTLVEKLSDAELLALENACAEGHPARATGLRIRAAMLAAVETYSRTQRTKTVFGAAIALGIVADVERAREILGDPGFSLS